MNNNAKEKILHTEIRKFCLENIDNVIVNRKKFMPNKLGYACFFELEDKKEIMASYEVKVYQTLGMDKLKLASFQDLGNYTVNIYEEMLNLYGLSLNNNIENNIYKKLEKN